MDFVYERRQFLTGGWRSYVGDRSPRTSSIYYPSAQLVWKERST
jgi:hypothetical protein